MKHTTKWIWVLILFMGLCQTAAAVQKARILSPDVEVYSDADFDSDVISEVHENETYQISSKVYGPFYKIKLKDGKIGYIVDYELDIEGKGKLKAQDLDEVFLEAEKKNQKEAKSDDSEEGEDPEDGGPFGHSYQGVAVSLINYHEDTMGGAQIDDLWAFGYKAISDFSWSAMGAFTAPRYYAAKTGGSAQGTQLWGDLGVSNPVGNIYGNDLRLGGALLTHLSWIRLSTPARNYDLQDITLGLDLEAALMVKIGHDVLDLSFKYYFDKSNYAGFGVSFLF